MKPITSKKTLARVLQQLKGFEKPKIRLEQYMTEPEVAADVLWECYMQGDTVDKTVADLGAGTGILGLGMLLLDASKVFFVEQDAEAIAIAKSNLALLEEEGYELGEAVFIVDKVENFNESVDVVVQNPPFGTKEKHADKVFLERAFIVGKVVYSLHKTATKAFVEAITKDHEFSVDRYKNYSYPLKASFSHHRRAVELILVTLWRFVK